jgi:hypothetical protein
MPDEYIVNKEGEIFFSAKDDPISPCGPDFTFEECGFDLAETLLPPPQGQCPEEGCLDDDYDSNGNVIDPFGGQDNLDGKTGTLGGGGSSSLVFWGPGGFPGRGFTGAISNPNSPDPLGVSFSGGNIPCGTPLGKNLGQLSVTGGGGAGPKYHADFVSGGESFSGWLDEGADYSSSPGYTNSIFTALPSSGKNPDELYQPGKTINASLLITVLTADGVPTDTTKTHDITFTVTDTGKCNKVGGSGSGSLTSQSSEGSAEPPCGYEVWEWQEIGAKGFSPTLSFTPTLSNDTVENSSIGISDPYFSIKEIVNGEVNINTATGVAVVGRAGQITAVTIINRGGGYATAPTISFSTGGGGAKFTAILTDEPVANKGKANESYGVESVFIDNPGSGLLGTEILKIGPDVITTLKSVNGIAQSVDVNQKGSGFSKGNPPIVQILESTNGVAMVGEGATATCEITDSSKSVSKVIITDGGKNYSINAPPKVIFSPAPDITTGCPNTAGGKGPGKITGVCAPINPRETLGLRASKSAVSIVFDRNADTKSTFKVTEKIGATGVVGAVGSGFATISITNGGSFTYYEGSAVVITGPGDIEPSNAMTTKEIENSTFVIHGIVTSVVTEEELASASLASSAAANPPPCDVGQWVKVQSCAEGCEAEDQNSSTFEGEPVKKYVRVGVPYKGVYHYAIILAPTGWTPATPATIAQSILGIPTNAIKFPTGATTSTTISLSTYFNSGNRIPDRDRPLTVDYVGSDGGMPYPPDCAGPEGAMDTGGVGKPDNGLGASSKRRYRCVKSGAPLGYGEFTPIIKKITPKVKKEVPCKKGDCDKLFSTWMAQAVGTQDENKSFEVNWILLEGCPEPCVNRKPDSNARIVESTLVDIPCSCYEVEEQLNTKTPDDSKPKNDYGIFSWKKFFNK